MKIEFISYDGKSPSLCLGRLTLRVDGKEITFDGFGDNYQSVPARYETKADYRKFWASGGSVTADKDWNFEVTQGEWELNDCWLPDFLKPYGKELIDLFNENVDWGCCGGCI